MALLADCLVLELSHRAATDSTATCEACGPAARGKDGCFWVPGPAGVTLELLLVGLGVRSQDHSGQSGLRLVGVIKGPWVDVAPLGSFGSCSWFQDHG